MPTAMPCVSNAVGRSALSNNERDGTIKTETAIHGGILLLETESISLNNNPAIIP